MSPASTAGVTSSDPGVTSDSSRATLVVDNVTKRFGGVTAISGFSMSAHPGVTGLIGPNGAGKSTVFNVITGLFRPDDGSITVNGIDVTTRAVHKIAQAGVRRTFQNIRLFAEQTALDNVAVGALSSSSMTVVKAREAAMETLTMLGLDGLASLRPHELPYACSDGSRSPDVWSPNRASCSWMSRPLGCTLRNAPHSSTPSFNSAIPA